MTAEGIPAAAARLGVSRATLRRWIANGAPVARRGHRGRGGACLVDPAAIAAWRGACPDELRAFAGELPELVADSIDEVFRSVTGAHKRAVAGTLAGTWYAVTSVLLDRLRRDAPDIPELSSVTASIERLREIARL